MRYGVGYRSLQRHIDLCLAAILSEQEKRAYETALSDTAALLRSYFAIKMRKPRPKSIITKPIEFTWSRRAWKSNKKDARKTQGSVTDYMANYHSFSLKQPE